MATWQEVQSGIFSGESNGDYNALFGYQNKENGLFSDIKITDMTIDEALKFADPKGEYASYVSLNNKGTVSTPMGAYQIVGRTLRDAKEELNLDGGLKLTKNVQDKIGKWLFETQGTDAWVGYKGPKVKGKNKMVAPNNNPMNVYSMFQDQMQPQRPEGIMGFLQDPRTRRALGTLSRTQVGARLAGLADKEMAENQTTGAKNKTIRYLMSQKDGRPYAEAILAGADARATLNDYLTATGKTGSSNIQSSVALPNLAGSLVTLKTGEVFVQTRNNERLTDPEEIDAYILKAQQGEIQNERDINAAREGGKLGERLEFAQRIKEAETFGAKKVEWVDEARNKSSNINSTIGLYKQALNLLQGDPPAKTGRVRKLIPTTSSQTALLETVKGELGLDVIGSVTFGALSESELNLAMDLGLPSDKLSNAELQEWLIERIEAKTKAATALQDTAAYLSQPQVTINSYYTDYLGINPSATETDAKQNLENSTNPLGL